MMNKRFPLGVHRDTESTEKRPIGFLLRALCVSVVSVSNEVQA